MQNLKLTLPSEAYLESYLEACREFKAARTGIASVHDPDEFDLWRGSIFIRYENDRLGIGLPPGYVPGTTFWCVEDGVLIGVGAIRHRLTESLERFGGHIGYAILPSRWNKGYGTVQLALLLKEARKLGIDSALITCDDDNIGSARVIEKNGGRHIDTIENIIGGRPTLTRRYHVDTAGE